MKKKVVCILMALTGSIPIISQNSKTDDQPVKLSLADETKDESIRRGVPSCSQIYKAEKLDKIGESYVMKIETESNYTCFGIGLKINNNNLQAGNFKFSYKMEKSVKDKSWGNLKTGEGEFTPNDTETGYYWSELFFGYDESPRKFIYLLITPPEGVLIKEVRIDAMDLSKEIDPSHSKEIRGNLEKSNSCPALPFIIPRADWCGNYTACTNASYTPTIIAPTHTIIHHGASPDTYTDGYAVVRSYWNYHVNTMGWADIGYNYLLDKFGNIFLGRKNANYATQDVRGSHAGNTNPKSIGVNFLGNGDVSTPTTLQLDKLYDLLGWWFKSRNISPNTSASIILQSGGTAVLNRIVGHKDVNIGGTACPGTVIYGLLETIRNETLFTINECIDQTKPTTNVAIPLPITTDFTANFSDVDNTGGSGINCSFYQVADFNGTEYRSNKDVGFYNDNFNTTLHSDWISQSGTWTINQHELNQQDNLSSNTNMYTSLSQSLGNKYLYNWKMKIVGTTTNRDAGLDIFCQDGSQTNQLNSYYIAIKPGENKIQIIEFNNNVSNLRAEAICTILSATQYDFKVIYDPTNGEINVYQNDIFLLSWIDSTPLTSGNQVSFRTTSCAASFDDFRVFKSRNSTAMVTVGNASTKEIRYQNPNLTTNTGKITSITTDIAKNISTEKSNEFKVDFWGPYVITNVNDGLSTDISSQESLTTISANWLATTDPNNTVTWYSYAIGTSPGASNILTWTNNGMNLSFTKSGLNLVNGSTYYVSIKSTNASGLSSTAKSSNGVLVSKSKTMINEAIKEQYNLTENPISLYPNPVSDYLQITNIDKRIQYKIYDINDHIMCNDFINDEFKIDVSNLKNGVYFIEILIDDSNLIRRFIKI